MFEAWLQEIKNAVLDLITRTKGLDDIHDHVTALPDSTAIETAAGTALATYDPPTKTEMDSAISPLALEATLTAIKGAGWSTETLAAIKTAVDAIPTTGSAVSSASGTTNGVIVQDGATGTPNVVEVIATSGAETFGSWTQLDASVSADSWLCTVTALLYNVNAGSINYCVEIGTGAAGSEGTKVRFSARVNYAASTSVLSPVVFTLPIPIKIASGTRVAARVSSNNAGNTLSYIGISYYQSLE